jgi:glucokinase
VHWAVNLDWLDLPLRELLEVRYRVPTYVLNDSHASVMAEYYFGRGGSTPNLIVIKCEEGLSAGIVLDGRLFRGDHFGAGEIGHVVFRDDDVRCRCGNTGCLETLASGSAIIRRVRAAVAADPRSRLHAAAVQQPPFDLEAVLAAYEAGDATVQHVVREAGRALGLAIAALVGTLNVRNIVLAGSVTQLGQPLLDAVRQEVLARSLAALARETQVDYSAIGPDITALGAAAVLLHEELGIWPFRGTVPALSPRD